mmetsp:Transcript_4857/g.14051  ORF Transcript_4857/g.14051 Transcript_4857/m.14051 type:complete len:217 (-) Transcript_4857:1106-1756(-)
MRFRTHPKAPGGTKDHQESHLGPGAQGQQGRPQQGHVPIRVRPGRRAHRKGRELQHGTPRCLSGTRGASQDGKAQVAGGAGTGLAQPVGVRRRAAVQRSRTRLGRHSARPTGTVAGHVERKHQQPVQVHAAGGAIVLQGKIGPIQVQQGRQAVRQDHRHSQVLQDRPQVQGQGDQAAGHRDVGDRPVGPSCRWGKGHRRGGRHGRMLLAPRRASPL